MKKIITAIFTIGTILTAAISINAQTAGSSGLSFLKMGFGARNIAMGDAGAAASNDVTSLFYNPAKLAGRSGNDIMIMHNQWIQDVSSEILGAQTTLFGLPVAFGFNVTTIGNIEIRTKPGAADATFNAHYFFGSISTGFNVVDNLSFGATARYLYEDIYTDASKGWGFDFGFEYSTPVKGLTAAAVVKNLGSMDQLRNEKTKLPAEIRIGPAYNFNLSEKFDVTVAGEYQKYTETSDTHFNLGGEVVYNKLLALRAGYLSGYESKNITAGIGLMWGNLSFDYAMSPFSLGLGTGHSLSLSFKF